MSAGTLTLTNKSAAVSGSGTAFTTELAAGDFAVVTVGGIPYTLPVKTVNSNTSLTLVSNFTGPTQAGAAWSAVPRMALNMVTAALVAQSAEALRGLNYDKQNWQNIFSGTGSVTVKLPDGSTWTGPAWNGIAMTITGKMDKSQNLNDIHDKAESRKNIGLGSSATRDAYSLTGSMLSEGDFGVGGSAFTTGGWKSTEACGFYQSDSFAPTATTYSGFKARIRDGVQFSLVGRAGRAFIQTHESGIAEGWRELTTTAISCLTLKSDVVYGDGSLSWANVSAMKPVTFRYNLDKAGHLRRGFIAQDLEKIDPQYIRRVNGAVDEDGTLREVLTLDTNPLLMDALVVLKMLIDKDIQRENEIKNLRDAISLI
ncbi:tail fiber domain-containing protein [Citrobacter sp. RHBSTW-00887]|uniref:tail fiber domain-containing protein n=1 Tax=Citrobacter sp. RHBSTW-00887 TaxID=2742668 RepID=UPI0015EA531A|nr:tail fiber domain-containing protein [Citrobacter sp. RHBSTW-00887]QLS55364.1 tail fiber domain-containing protein [Citrobacter sp. RHBSTW-00887]